MLGELSTHCVCGVLEGCGGNCTRTVSGKVLLCACTTLCLQEKRNTAADLGGKDG